MERDIDLVTLPKKSFWKLSIPLVGFCLFNTFYSLVDLWWISQYDADAFFAVGFCIPLVTLILSLGDSLGRGTNSLMSRFFGSKNYENGYNSLIHGLIMCFIVWICILIMVPFLKQSLLSVNLNLGRSIDIILDYLIPICIFSFSFILVNFFSETMQAEGNSKVPSILIILSNILNIILDPIFLFVFDFGVKGVAYATIISSLSVLLILVYFYFSDKTKVPLSFKYFKFSPYTVKEILIVTFPNFIDSALWSFSGFFINNILISAMGEIGIIIYSVSNNLKDVILSPIKGFGRALMSVTGHLFGAREFDALNEMHMYVLKQSILVTFIIMAVFSIFRNQIFSLFSISIDSMVIFWITVFGFIIVLSLPFSLISSKMLDGFGKSTYSGVSDNSCVILFFT